MGLGSIVSSPTRSENKFLCILLLPEKATGSNDFDLWVIAKI